MRRAFGAWGVRLIVLGTLVLAGTAHAQTKTGTTIGQVMLIEPSARMSGMGNAGVSLADGLDGVFYNPAAAGQLTGWGFTFTHSAWLAGVGYDYAAAGAPVMGWGTAYLSVTSLHSGDMEVRTVSQPLGTGERFGVSDIALGLGFGRQISERFAAGAQVTWLQETIWHTSANTFVLSAGTVYRISKNGLHIGSSLSNFGTQGRFLGSDLQTTFDQDPTRNGDNGALPAEQLTDGFPVPVLFRIGAGYPFVLGPRTRLEVALDAFHPADNSESVSAGAELTYRELASLRLGYQNAFQEDSELGLTAGGGVQGRIDTYAYHLNYAWADHRRLGGTHRVTIGVTF